MAAHKFMLTFRDSESMMDDEEDQGVEAEMTYIEGDKEETASFQVATAIHRLLGDPDMLSFIMTWSSLEELKQQTMEVESDMLEEIAFSAEADGQDMHDIEFFVSNELGRIFTEAKKEM